MSFAEIFFGISSIRRTPRNYSPPPSTINDVASHVTHPLFIYPRSSTEVGAAAVRGQTATPTQRRRRRRRRDWGLAPRLHRPRRRSDRAPVSLLAVRATAAQTLQPLAGVLLLAPHATPSPSPAAPRVRHPRSDSRIHESAEHNRGGGRAQMPAVLVYETRLDAADWWLPRPVGSTSVAEKPEEVGTGTARRKTQEKGARLASGRRAVRRIHEGPRGSTKGKACQGAAATSSCVRTLRDKLIIHRSRDRESARSPRCVLIYVSACCLCFASES